MIRFVITIIVLVVLILATQHYVSEDMFQTFETSEQEYIKHIGSDVIIKSDTLQVIDYSMWDSTYTLSNGVKVHKNIVNTKNK